MNFHRRLFASSCSFALLGSGIAAAPAVAQDAQPQSEQWTLEEVTVTARRRSESLQDVPISIVSKSDEYLERSRVASVSELSRVVPGFVFNEIEGGQQSTAQLRGLSSFAFETSVPQSVGFVVDDVVLAFTGQSINQFNDIQRIEVLRGPQGTLFGRNTTGGVVHVVTHDPTDAFEGKLSASYGSYDQVKWSGTINGPLGEDVAARASVFTVNRDGYIENVHDGRMLESEQQAGMATKFLYTPSDSARLKLSLSYTERDRQGRAQPILALGPLSSQEHRDSAAGLVGPENDKVNGIGFQPFSEQVGAASLTWNQDLGEFELTSISAFQYWRFHMGDGQPFHSFNFPTEPLNQERFYAPSLLRGWSQEVRLASPQNRRVEYVAGVFSSASSLDETRDYLFNISSDPSPAGAVYLFNLAQQVTDHLDYAVFGEADFHLTETVTFTAGLRWTRDETDVSLDAEPAPFFDPEEGVGIGPLGEAYIPFQESEFPGRREMTVGDSELTWRTGLRWEPTQDVMFYGTAARGFKGPTITALGILGAVEPEIVTSYEVGTKAASPNNRVNTSLSVFYSTADDLQTQGESTLMTPQGPVTSVFLTNAAEVRSRGVELELSAVPTESLALDLGLAYIDATFTKYPRASCYPGQTEEEGCNLSVEPNVQDLSGKQLPFVPKWSGNVASTYSFALPFWDATQFLRLDYAYRGKINGGHTLAPNGETRGVGVWGLTLGLTSPDERFEVLASIKNLTDEFVVNGLDGGKGTLRAHLYPEYQRTWGITFNYRFPSP